MAPEVLLGEYTEQCDVWSLGVILHLLLIGAPPFYSEDEEEIHKQILDHERLVFDDPGWAQISDDAKDLVSKMITPAHNRISMQ
jgi:serine/threonine protein kinase